MNKNKPECLMFFIDSIPESHPFFQFSHITKIQTFMSKQKKLESNIFWGTFFSIFALEKTIYSRNLIYRLTFFRTLTMTLVKYFIIPSFCGNYVVFRNNIKFKPILQEITNDYDFEDEKFKRVFEEFVSSKPEGFKKMLELQMRK